MSSGVLEMKKDKLLKSKLRIRLAELEKTQKEVAEDLGVTQQVLSSWVTGNSHPTLVGAFKLSRYLNCSIYDVWEWIEDKEE